ncbi:FAD:protein FMN transferase [soil metagenome]
MIEVLRRRRAKATLFEVMLVGEDDEHLEAVGEAALDEVVRVEQMLSRYDPVSELSRLNRLANESVLVTVELHQLLVRCRKYRRSTHGLFDPTLTGSEIIFDGPEVCLHGACLDLGGIGKGYALDRVVTIIRSFGIEHFLLHGGTSSVFAVGQRADGTPWSVSLRGCQEQIILENQALSCSGAGEDLIEPQSQEPLAGTQSVAVIAPLAELAEVWSTAALVAGLDHARSLRYPDGSSVAWIEAGSLIWLTGEPR